MKIDVFWVWFIAFGVALLFQNYFTVKKTDWDVSYTFTTDSMDYIGYGQQSITCSGDNMTWTTLRTWLEQNIQRENVDNSLQVVVLAAHKGESNRFWHPFWKALSNSA